MYSVTYDGQIKVNIPVRTSATGCTGFEVTAAAGGESCFDAVPEYMNLIEGTPIMVNTNTGFVVVHDSFENATDVSTNAWFLSDTQNAIPNRATKGGWDVTANTNNIQVTDYAIPGAHDGTNYLRIHRTGTIYPYIYLRGVTQTNGTVHVAIMINSDDASSASINLVDNTKLIASIAIGVGSNGEITCYYGNAYHMTGIPYTLDVWQKLEIDWEVGSSTYDLTYNGQSSNSIPVRTSATKCNGISLGGILNKTWYCDAVPPPPPSGTMIIIK